MPSRKMGLLGRKLGMTQSFSDSGERRAVTVVAAGPCVVLRKLTPEHDGYAAIQVGFEEKPERLVSRPERGLFAKAKAKPRRFVREYRLADAEALSAYEVGQEVRVADVFAAGDYVDVVGTSKGKGFQGVVRRYHFAGSVEAHGSHEFFRHGGSIGCRLTPGRVHKGKRMAGHMGDVRCTVQNLRVFQVLADENVLLIEGAVPGGRNGLVSVHPAVKTRSAHAAA